MKNTILFLLLGYAGTIYAGDTLTRAEIYNFSVGDSFGYLNHGCNGCRGPLDDIYIIDVVADRFYSQAGDTVFYLFNREWSNFGTSNVHRETNLVFYDSLQKFEVPSYFDTTGIPVGPLYYCSSIYDSTSIFNNRKMDWTSYSVAFAGTTTAEFVEGLGMVRYANQCVASCPMFYNGPELIFYSKGSERWGTPVLVTAINESSNGRIPLIFPTVNQGQFWFSADENSYISEFALYDVVGNKVGSQKITSGKNEIDFTCLSKGLYLWTIESSSGQFRSGKMVLVD